MNGDNLLSPRDLNLWSLVYACLYKFGCPVIFTLTQPNALTRTDSLLIFFVPRHNENAVRVTEYIREELKDVCNPGKTLDGASDSIYIPGTQLMVEEFKGVDFYLESDVISDMTERALNDFVIKVRYFNN